MKKRTLHLEKKLFLRKDTVTKLEAYHIKGGGITDLESDCICVEPITTKLTNDPLKCYSAGNSCPYPVDGTCQTCETRPLPGGQVCASALTWEEDAKNKKPERCSGFLSIIRC